MLDRTGDFEKTGSLAMGEKRKQKTKIRFRKVDDFEVYNNAIDIDYDSEDVTFTRYLYKLNTPEFNKVTRSQYGKCTDSKQDFVVYSGNNC